MSIERLQKTVYDNYDETPKDYQTPPDEVGAWDMEQITGKINELVDKEIGEDELSSGVKRQVLEKQSSDDFDFKWNYRFHDFLINVQYNGNVTEATQGQILECIIDQQLIYRFVSNTINTNGYPEEDSFYQTFTGSSLENLIISRG